MQPPQRLSTGSVWFAQQISRCARNDNPLSPRVQRGVCFFRAAKKLQTDPLPTPDRPSLFGGPGDARAPWESVGRPAQPHPAALRPLPLSTRRRGARNRSGSQCPASRDVSLRGAGARRARSEALRRNDAGPLSAVSPARGANPQHRGEGRHAAGMTGWGCPEDSSRRFDEIVTI